MMRAIPAIMVRVSGSPKRSREAIAVVATPPRRRAQCALDGHVRFSAVSSRRQTMEPRASAGMIMSRALGPHHSGSKSR